MAMTEEQLRFEPFRGHKVVAKTVSISGTIKHAEAQPARAGEYKAVTAKVVICVMDDIHFPATDSGSVMEERYKAIAMYDLPAEVADSLVPELRRQLAEELAAWDVV
jgi:hypothetical protein